MTTTRGTATNHWKLGLFVVAGIGAILASLFWVGAERFQRASFPAVTYFDESVQGLDVGSPLKFRGVTLGAVSNITIAPDHRHVEVTADIFVDAARRFGLSDGAPSADAGRPILPADMRVQIAAAGITGTRFLEIDFVDPARSPAPPLPFAPPWNYVPSSPSTLLTLQNAALAFAERLPALGESATTTLAEGRATLDSMRRLTDELQGGNGSINRLAARLDATTRALESALREAKAGETTASLREASASIAAAGRAVQDDLDDVREELHASLASLRGTLDLMHAFAESLDRDPSVLLRGRPADAPAPAAAR